MRQTRRYLTILTLDTTREYTIWPPESAEGHVLMSLIEGNLTFPQKPSIVIDCKKNMFSGKIGPRHWNIRLSFFTHNKKEVCY